MVQSSKPRLRSSRQRRSNDHASSPARPTSAHQSCRLTVVPDRYRQNPFVYATIALSSTTRRSQVAGFRPCASPTATPTIALYISGSRHMLAQQLRRASKRLAAKFDRVSRKTWRLLLRIALVILIVPVLLQILLAYVVGKDARLLPPALQNAKSLLIVTAHPDDECLFFAPSILGVLDMNPDIVGGLLVLSTGKISRRTKRASLC
jgi:hypothetical protein